MAIFLFILRTFVVPGFLEPILRGSGSLLNLQIKIALEIDPQK